MKLPKVDAYFLSCASYFSKRRGIKYRPLWIIISVPFGVLLLYVLFFVPSPKASKHQTEKRTSPPLNLATPGAVEIPKYVENPYNGRESAQPMRPSRSYTAPQIVPRNSSASNDRLPLGTTIPAKILNTVLSSDHSSPVIALVTQETYFENEVLLAQGTKAFGQASFDNRTKRLQVRFHTFVTPDGSQYPFSGLALLPDGSSGLPGIFHGQLLAHQVGRSSSTFVGGLASGLKDKEAGGFGGPIEPGSLKNGLLNGLADVAQDQARVFADDMKATEPYLEVPKDTLFLIYLEQAWSPGSPR